MTTRLLPTNADAWPRRAGGWNPRVVGVLHCIVSADTTTRRPVSTDAHHTGHSNQIPCFQPRRSPHQAAAYRGPARRDRSSRCSRSHQTQTDCCPPACTSASHGAWAAHCASTASTRSTFLRVPIDISCCCCCCCCRPHSVKRRGRKRTGVEGVQLAEVPLLVAAKHVHLRPDEHARVPRPRCGHRAGE